MPINIASKKDCTGCAACANICPKGCITMAADEEGFLYPALDKAQCVDCGACERVCPALGPLREQEQAPVCYAAYSTDVDSRLVSSSGGIFKLLSAAVINAGGVVVGAAFDSELNVVHRIASTQEELAPLLGSKYVQSDAGYTFARAKEQLDSGRQVLFSGTPCQVAGFASYIGREYENLILVDLVCHGAPSPYAWRSYLSQREAAAGARAAGASFRDKSTGWSTYSVRVDFEDGTQYKRPHSSDAYMRAFLCDLTLRPSCYECRHKSPHRSSDITLADFWGIQEYMPDMNDGKGVSLVMAHTEKGRRLYEKVSPGIISREAELNVAVAYNPSAVRSQQKPSNRDAFLRALNSRPFDELVERYTRVSLIKRVIGKVRRVIGKSKS